MSGKQKNNRQSATRNLQSANGFSLLELIITLGVLAILVMGTIPLAQNAVKRQKEMRLRENLRTIRAAYGLGEFSVFEVVNEQRRLTESVTGYNQSLRDYYNALTELETALGSTLPASGFAPVSTSVLPDEKHVPQQINKETFLKSLEIKTPGKKTSGQTALNQKSDQ